MARSIIYDLGQFEEVFREIFVSPNVLDVVLDEAICDEDFVG